MNTQKNTVGKVLIAILLIACAVGVFFVMPILDLLNTADVKTIDIQMAYNFYEVEHSVAGIIPVGKDHYFLGLDLNNQNVYLIKGNTKWLKDTFDEEGNLLKGSSYKVSGLSKRISDFEVEDALSVELASFLEEIPNVNSGLEVGYNLEINYKKDAILRIVAGAAILLFIAAAFFVNKAIGLSGPLKKVFVAIGLVVLAFALYTIV